MKKEIYEIPTLELLQFELANIVTTSISIEETNVVNLELEDKIS